MTNAPAPLLFRGGAGDGVVSSALRASPPPTPSSEQEGASTFADAATRLAGLAAQALGWRPEEFWRATPAELALSLGAGDTPAPPSRAEFLAMMERDADARHDR